jgi:hypothetical protein
LLVLPSLLLKSEKYFELKYQAMMNLAEGELAVFERVFKRMFGEDYEKKFKGKSYSLQHLMELHRKLYNLVGNLHDLFCRGTKDYKSALINVLAYNSSRQVASQASIPDING